MAHINRKYIDRHWLTFIFRGAIALIFGGITLFSGKFQPTTTPAQIEDLTRIFTSISIFLIAMGIVDSASALYNSTKKHGWVTSIIDAAIDIIAALVLLFLSNNEPVFELAVLAIYVLVSGIIDIFHSFLSTPDPTDRFIRIVAGSCGCIMSFVILNSVGGTFDHSMFARFFGVYMLIVGVTSLIYGAHNRAQISEDSVARKEAATSKKASKKASGAKSLKKSKK